VASTKNPTALSRAKLPGALPTIAAIKKLLLKPIKFQIGSVSPGQLERLVSCYTKCNNSLPIEFVKSLANIASHLFASLSK